LGIALKPIKRLSVLEYKNKPYGRYTGLTSKERDKYLTINQDKL